jgi:DNA-binding HxlR family transcriptional regulator
MDGPLRFMEIKKKIEDISPKILSKELKDLEARGFIMRTVYCTTPVVVEYKLLPYSDTLKPVINELTKWVIDNKHQ